MYLPFTSWLLALIQLAELEAAEERFDGRGGVAVRPGEDHLEAQLADNLQGNGAGMIGCVVPQKHGVLLPARRFLIKSQHQLLQEQSNDVAVGRRMPEAEPHVAASVERRYHGESRRDGVEPHVAQAVSADPGPPDEAGLVEPGLVDVDYSFTLFQELNEGDRVLLSLDQYLFRVGVREELLRSDEGEPQVPLHDLPRLP